jgi:hypothetical protein
MSSGDGVAGFSWALRVAGLAAVVVAAVSVPVQGVYLARVARTQLSAPHEHDIRTLFMAAARHIPEGAPFAVTSVARTRNVVYLLRRRNVVRVDLNGPTAAVRARLQNAGVRFVIVLFRNRPPAFSARDATWYRVLVGLRAGQVVEVTG